MQAILRRRIASRAICREAWCLMLLLALIWGGCFASNRVAVVELGPVTTVAFRVSGGAVLLGLWVWSRGLRPPPGWRWVWIFVALGALGNSLPFAMIVWGQQHIPSGLAGILNAGSGVFAVLLVAAVFPDERLSWLRGVGVVLAVAGVAVAVGIGSLSRFDPTQLAQLAVLGAGLCHATAMVLARILLRRVQPMVAAAGLLAGAAAVALPAALWIEGLPTLHYAPETWAAIAYLAAGGSALAYALYFRILRIAGPGNLALVPLMVSPSAILLGALLFGEVLEPSAYAGFALLATGLLVIDGRPFRRRRAHFA